MRLTVVAAFATLALSSAYADDTPPETSEPPAQPAKPKKVTAKTKAEAKKLVKEATKLYNVQQFAEAAETYQKAYLLDPQPAYLYAVAQSQRQAGDCAHALQTYQAFLRTQPAEGERDKAQKNIERCEQEIRDKEAAVKPEEIAPPEPPPPPPPPPVVEKVAPPPPPPPPPAPEGKSYLAGHVMLGLGLGAIAGGVYFLRDGRQAIDDHNNAITYDAFIDGQSNADKARTKQRIGAAAIGGGSALVLGAVLFYVLHSRGGDEEPQVSAAVAPGSATLTLSGSF
jgi:tetratricopeptide (TPR) repeat protein